MKLYKTDRQGFSAELVLVLVVLVAIGLVGWLFYSKQHSSSSNTNSAQYSTQAANVAPNGSTANLENSLLQDGASENSIDNSNAAQAASNVSATNSQLSGIGASANDQQ